MSTPFSEVDQGLGQTLTNTQQFWLGQWQQWQQWQASGLSMAAYARDQGLSVKSFYYWGKQVRALKADKKPDRAHGGLIHNSKYTSEDWKGSIFARWLMGEFRPGRAITGGNIHKLLTDNGKRLTDRFCAKHGNEQRLINPGHPPQIRREPIWTAQSGSEVAPQGRHEQTNGMIKRFNERMQEDLATTRLDSSQNLEKTLMRYIRL